MRCPTCKSRVKPFEYRLNAAHPRSAYAHLPLRSAIRNHYSKRIPRSLVAMTVKEREALDARPLVIIPREDA